MAKVYFRYGTMRSGKTLDLLKVAHNYEELERKVVVLTPDIDTRNSLGIISSRAGMDHDGVIISSDTDLFDLVLSEHTKKTVSCVLVDEAQFLTREQVLQLCRLADDRKIPVIAYGLKSDFQGNLFEGSEAFLVYADKIEEIKTICWCGKKATFNARVKDGVVITEGEQIMIGDEEYVPLCREHYMSGILPP